MPVCELLKRMPSSELTEWMAFDQLEPFGEPRADMRAALVCATTANSRRGRDDRPFGLDDFMLGPFGPEAQDEAAANERAVADWHAHRAARAIRRMAGKGRRR